MGKKKSGKPSAKKRKKKGSGGSRSSSGSGGGSLMGIRGGFKGAVGSMTGKKPKTRRGALISNVIWTVLTLALLALLAYKIYGWMK